MCNLNFKIKGHPDFQTPLKIEIGIESMGWDLGVSLRGVTSLPDSTLAYWVTGFEMEEYNTQWGFRHNCPFKLGRDDAKRLMDNLWNRGIRPSEIEGNRNILDEDNEDELSAIKKHLEDIRKLVFNKGE